MNKKGFEKGVVQMNYETLNKIKKEVTVSEKRSLHLIHDLEKILRDISEINKEINFVGNNSICFLDFNYLSSRFICSKNMENEAVFHTLTKAANVINYLNKDILKLNNQLNYIEIMELKETNQFDVVLKEKSLTDNQLYSDLMQKFVIMANNKLQSDIKSINKSSNINEVNLDMSFIVYDSLFYYVSHSFITKSSNDCSFTDFYFDKEDFLKMSFSQDVQYEDIRDIQSTLKKRFLILKTVL